jgi:hypothetical protein
MNSSNTSRGTAGEPAGDGSGDWYEIRVQGRLDDHWAAWFDGLDLTRTDDGTTLLRGPVTDQAALHGLLHKLRDLGVPLHSVTRTDPGPDA